MDSFIMDYGLDHKTGKWKVPGIYNSHTDELTLEEINYYNNMTETCQDISYIFQDRSYNPKEISKDWQEQVELKRADMIGKNDVIDFVEKDWKTREILDVVKYEDILIYSKGFEGKPKELKFNGWELELVTNNYTNKTRLYLYHSSFHIIGRCDFNDRVTRDGYAELEFLLPCKEFKKNYANRDRVRLYPQSIITYSNISDIPTETLLKLVKERFKAETPKKKIKIVSNVVDITELLDRIKAKQEAFKITDPAIQLDSAGNL